jgi:hypothetical protein
VPLVRNILVAGWDILVLVVVDYTLAAVGMRIDGLATRALVVDVDSMHMEDICIGDRTERKDAGTDIRLCILDGRTIALEDGVADTQGTCDRKDTGGVAERLLDCGTWNLLWV